MSKLRVAVVAWIPGAVSCQKRAALADCELAAIADTNAEASGALASELGTTAVGIIGPCWARYAISIATPTTTILILPAVFSSQRARVGETDHQSVEQAQQLIAGAPRQARPAGGPSERFNPAILPLSHSCALRGYRVPSLRRSASVARM
jgi:hypothetical protein